MFTSSLILKALEEDIGSGDLTAASVVPKHLKGCARMLAKQDMVLAGMGVAGGVFSAVDSSFKISQLCKDGQKVRRGTYVMTVEGSLQHLLMAERTALNFIQRMSGIATLTSQYVEQTQGTPTKILDTRKTTPLLRHLEKYAVTMGGGINHRMGLYDEMMIKDNHIAALGGDIVHAITLARKAHPNHVLVVEVNTQEQLSRILHLPINRVMLDNMNDVEVWECLQLIQKKIPVEISGGITLERVRVLANMGVDFISVGALTHSVKAADLSLEFDIQS